MSKTGKIQEGIVADIRAGKYPPGSRLPTRHELMDQYGIARASADKIVRRLCAEGWLVSNRGSGTFVANISGTEKANIYIILNTEKICINSNFMERHWSFLVNEAGVRNNTLIIGSHELDKFLPAIRNDKFARLIWTRPAMSSYSVITSLQAVRHHQILVNRPIPEYNYVYSDVRSALEKAMTHVRKIKPDAIIGIIPPAFNIEEHYLAEREALFYELANMKNIRIFTGRRASRSNHRDVIDSADQLIKRKPDFLYIPDYYMTSPVVTMLHDRKISPVSDIKLITFDWNEIHGIICLKQRWEEVFRTALKWAAEPHPPEMQSKIEMDVSIP